MDTTEAITQAQPIDLSGIQPIPGAPEIQPEEPTVELFPEAARMPLFWENMAAEERIVVNQGGMYSGKTESIMRVLFFYCIQYPNLIVDVVANSIPKLKEDAMAVAARIVEGNPFVRFYLLGRLNISDRVYTFKNGSTLSFKSYENSEQAEGRKRDVLYINEARRIDWDVAHLLIKRTNQKVFLDYNPVARFWVHDEIIECPEVEGTKEFPSVKVIRSWHIHNDFISQDKHNDIENMADPEMWKAYARGLTAKLSGLVYPGWVKVPANYIDSAPDCIWGVDLGFTNDPTVMLKCALNYKGYDYIFKSFGYAPGIPTGDMAHQMKEQGGYKFGQPCYMDHNDAVRRELRQLRIVAVNAFKPKGSVYQGILHLRTKRVAFCEESGELKKYGLEYELRRHSFAIDRNGKTMNEPEHRFSHGPSAARYAAYTHAVRHGLIKQEFEDDSDKDATDETTTSED